MKVIFCSAPFPGIPYRHPAGHPLELGGLQSHPLSDAQRGPSLRRRQRSVSQHIVPRHEVKLNCGRVVLQSKKTLPHDWVLLREETSTQLV